jgi:hypothetical protein
VEFCVIDVLNRLHDQQENHSDDMTRVMQRFDELAQRAGCAQQIPEGVHRAVCAQAVFYQGKRPSRPPAESTQSGTLLKICVIHHTNKAGGVKGSTAIEGWADYVVRLEQSPEDDSVKKLFIKTKSSGTIPPGTIRYWQSRDQSESRIELVRQRGAGLASCPQLNCRRSVATIASSGTALRIASSDGDFRSKAAANSATNCSDDLLSLRSTFVPKHLADDPVSIRP